MTTKDDYTAAEWQLLIDIPSLVGTAVMVSAHSGLGSMKEAFAIARGVLGAKDGYEQNELIQSLTESRIKDGMKSKIESVTDNPYRGMSASELAEVVTEKCRAVSELLAAKSTEEEAADYKQWSLSVGQQVANAAKEGGFLGIGGVRVSEAEKQILETIETALT